MTETVYVTAELPSTAMCLVMVQSALVALDIQLAISDTEPGASVMVVKDMVGAFQALEGVARAHVAFLEISPLAEEGYLLADAVRLRGGRVVFLGDEAEDLGRRPCWTVLVRPFTNNCVQAILKGLPGGGTVAKPAAKMDGVLSQSDRSPRNATPELHTAHCLAR